MRSQFYLGLGAALTFASAVAAAPLSTNRSDVLSYPAAGPEFDALNARASELEAAGLPPRPDPQSHPAAYAAWARAVSAPTERVNAVIAEHVLRHGQNLPSTDKDATSTNWSGYVLSGANGTFQSVAAEFIVPAAGATSCSGSWAIASSWVGIDGAQGSADVLQAGTDSGARCGGGGPALAEYDAWYEWFPGAAMTISNMPISAGDDVFVQIWASSSTVGHFYMVDYNSLKSLSLMIAAPSGTQLAGNDAEWIVERPATSANGTLLSLANYGRDFFSGCYASASVPANGSTLTSGMTPSAPGSATATAVQMIDSSNAPLSNVMLVGPTTLEFEAVPAAVSGSSNSRRH